MPQPNTSNRRKLTTRDHLRLAHVRVSQEQAEHAHALQRELDAEQQREADAQQREAHTRQRIADGIQQQQEQAIGLQELQDDLTLTRSQLVELDRTVTHGDQLLRQHLLAVLDPLQQLQQLQQQTQQDQSTDLQEQLSTMQRLLVDALAQLGRPKKVSIQRNERGKISGATVS